MAMPALAYASRHPERVHALILPLGYARWEPTGAGPDRIHTTLGLARTDWGMCKEFLAQSIGFDSPEAHRAMKKLIDEAVSQQSYIEFAETVLAWDVTGLLKDVRAPVLVLARRESQAVPIEAVRELAAGLPDAEFVTLEGSVASLVAPDATAAIAGFLRRIASSGAPERSRAPAPAAGLRTVLFTDIVGHTEMMQRLGDQKGRDVLREHERITRGLLKQHGGAEVKTMGDGFMASFGSVTSAVECAIALQRAFASHTESMPEPLHVRVGLNAGEPIEEDGDLFGATVILASRIAAKAEAGEILVADTVRGLCSGKGFLFADRGEFVAKGFEEAVRVYEVRWRE
jgi:class 3 adenylate cyclase